MARFKALCAGLIVLAACEGAPDEEHAQYYLMESQMHAAMLSDARRLELREQARKGEPSTPVMWIDIIKRHCKKHEEPEPLHMWPFPTNRASYIPEEQYTEVAYYCMQDYMWYYRFVSPDKKTDVILGPYFVERMPQGGGPDYRRGGPIQHKH